MARDLDKHTSNIWPLSKIEACQKSTGVPFLTAEEAVTRASMDFGGLFKGKTSGVAFPQSTDHISALIKFASNAGLKFTIRSGGYSQGGQTLAPKGGATLDCSLMTNITSPDITAHTLTCQPGTTWGQVVATTASFGLLPKAMPFFHNLTVGGVLSIGGIGGNSHTYGCVSANARELEVVTGTGDIIKCSRYQEPDLFEASLCGLGRCGVISSATIDLRVYKPKVATYYLLYTDHKTWLDDIQNLWSDDTCDFLEAFCTPSLQGLFKDDNLWKPLPVWLFNLQISFEYSHDEDLMHHQKILDSLRYWRLLHKEFSDTLDFVSRYGTRAKNMKSSGTWNHPHPWFECMLPLEEISKILPDLLHRLPLTMGDGLGYRLFFIRETDNTPPSFRMPKSTSPIIGFAALPTSITEQNQSNMLDTLEEVHNWLTSIGGKRCLAGWLGRNPDTFWSTHFEEYFHRWKELKIRYDPHSILQSILLQTVP